jgi:hypothetical protein
MVSRYKFLGAGLLICGSAAAFHHGSFCADWARSAGAYCDQPWADVPHGPHQDPGGPAQAHEGPTLASGSSAPPGGWLAATEEGDTASFTGGALPSS